MSRFNPLLKILYEIEIECADAIEKQRTEETEKNLDNFTKMKRRMAAEMRDLRKVTNPMNFCSLGTKSIKIFIVINVKIVTYYIVLYYHYK